MQAHTARSTSIIGLVALLAAVAAPKAGIAGLVVDLERAQKIAPLARIDVQMDAIEAYFSDGDTLRLLLPAGVPALLDDWMRDYPGGPLVVSIDGALIPGAHEYLPPSMPKQLGNLFFRYDTFAHSVACGAIPTDAMTHPLIRAGRRDELPDRRAEALLAADATEPAALRYQQLARRYVEIPGCVGDFTIGVTLDERMRPRAVVSPWLHTITALWYRFQDVPDEMDRWVGRLPYRPLMHDLIDRWPAYREAFPVFDEFSAVVEALALLRAARLHGRPVALVGRVTVDGAPMRRSPLMLPPDMPQRQWRERSLAWIDERVDTLAEADLALQWLWTCKRGGSLCERRVDPHERAWLEGVEHVAERDDGLQSRLELWKILDELTKGKVPTPAQLSALLGSEAPSDRFRLYSYAVTLITVVASELSLEERPSSLWDDIYRRLADRLRTACAEAAAGAGDIDTWEARVRDLYSTGLLRDALSHPDQATRSTVARHAACVHRGRAGARQIGWELGIRHAHYRFLGYLAGTDRLMDEDREVIREHRGHVANQLGISDWRKE